MRTHPYMSRYYTPKWYKEYQALTPALGSYYVKAPPIESKVTDEMLSRWEQMEKEETAERDTVINEERSVFAKARDLLLEFYSSKSKEYKYVSKLRYPWPLSNCYSLSNVRTNVTAYRKRQEDEAKKKEQEDKDAVYLGEAIQYLISKGKVLNTDFTVADAIYNANEIAFDEFRTKWLEDNKDEYFDFIGKNCDECEGWMPGFHRCECGNRRINATVDGDFKNQHMEIEAY